MQILLENLLPEFSDPHPNSREICELGRVVNCNPMAKGGWSCRNVCGGRGRGWGGGFVVEWGALLVPLQQYNTVELTASRINTLACSAPSGRLAQLDLQLFSAVFLFAS